MAFLTRKEFCYKCGVSSSNLTNYIKRGKVAKSGDYFDDSTEPNKSFIAGRIKLQAEKQAAEPAPKRQKPIPPTPPDLNNGDAPESPPPNIESDETTSSKPYEDLASLTEEKMRVDIERIKSVEQLNQLKIQKQQGDLIPTELVKPLIAQLSMSLSSAFKQAGDNLIVEFTHKKKLGNAETAELRERLTFVINSAIKEAVSEAKRGTNRIASDFSATRSVGERE